MYEKKTCCFTGHRPQKLGYGENTVQCDQLKQTLKNIIVSLIEKEDVTHFISGMALGVDTFAAQIVIDLKKEYPWITLECAIPCETQAEKWHERDRDLYFHLIAKCDKETLLQHKYTANCMQRRNKYMVNNSDFVLAVWNGKPSGTGNTVFYAEKQGKTVIQIEPKTLKLIKSK